jgi:hypothetical protein
MAPDSMSCGTRFLFLALQFMVSATVLFVDLFVTRLTQGDHVFKVVADNFVLHSAVNVVAM